MTMIETPVADQKPKPRRKRHARANKRPAVVAAPKPPSELAGIAVKDCPAACKILRRFNAAKRIIGDSKLDLTV